MAFTLLELAPHPIKKMYSWLLGIETTNSIDRHKPEATTFPRRTRKNGAIMTETIVRYALGILNEKNNGKGMFEVFCQNLVKLHIDPGFLKASGTDAGGDGGIDGWSLLGQNGRIKYAFSIEKNSKAKIESEIAKTDSGLYSEIRFLTNQSIRQKTKEDIAKSHKNFKIIIYDMEDLASFVIQNEELGHLLDLNTIQNSITLDYLKKHNQLGSQSSVIDLYIPRTITFMNPGEKRLIDIPLQDYCARLPSFTIIQAPAGYGKTCTLQQLHQKILREETSIRLPPVFIQLSSYIPTTLFEMVKQGMSENVDYKCSDFLLLLDGFDEVKDADKETLLKEISQIVNMQSSFRKAIVTARENSFTKTAFDEYFDVTIVNLTGLIQADVESLLRNERIPMDAWGTFFSNNFFLEFSDNIFYVIKFVEFYRLRGGLASSVIELFNFVAESEIANLFRKNRPSTSLLESLALYMTLNQHVALQESDVLYGVLPSIKTKSFKFSHKSVQEYFAAVKIAKQSIEAMKDILFRENIVIPYLSNTLGFVLNILSQRVETYTIFEELVEWSLSGAGNARRMLQIESDKISPDMNCSVFKAVIEQEAISGDYFDKPKSLLPFGLRKESKKRNLDYIVEKLLGSLNRDDFHYTTSILQEITYTHLDVFGLEYQKVVVDYFLELLRVENISKNASQVASLLYSIAHFPVVARLDSEILDFIVKQLLSIQQNDNVIENVSALLAAQGITVKRSWYRMIFDSILSSVEAESHQMAHYVPTQVADDSYNKPLKVTYFRSFIPLTEKLLDGEPDLAVELMRFTLEKRQVPDYGSPGSRDLSEIFQVFFLALEQIFERQPIDQNGFETAVEWILADISSFRESDLWKFLRSSRRVSVLERIANNLIMQSGVQCFSLIIDFYREDLVVTEVAFDEFMSRYGDSSEEPIKSFFEFFCYRTQEGSPIYEYVLSKLDLSLKAKIAESKKIQEGFLVRNKHEAQEHSQGYKIAFNKSELVIEMQRVSEAFPGEVIVKENFYSLSNGNLTVMMNPFVRYIFESLLTLHNGTFDKAEIDRYLKDSYHNRQYVTQVILYGSMYGIDFDGFSPAEKDEVSSWMKEILASYPLDTIERPLKWAHVALAQVLRRAKFLCASGRFSTQDQQSLIGLAFSGFSSSTFGAVMIGYDAFSIDYLDSYIEPKSIVDFICLNFKSALPDQQKLIAVCGYLLGHESLVLPYQRVNIVGILVSFIDNGLASIPIDGVVELARAFGFNLMHLDLDRLAEAFVLNSRRDDLEYNLASSFIKHGIHIRSNDELVHLSNSLRRAFERSTDLFLKKTIAEYYISFNEFAGDIFTFYAEYLLASDANTILERLSDGGYRSSLKTADIAHLPHIERLFRYSVAKKVESDRRTQILHIALSSYVAISDTCNSSEELEPVLKSMRAVSGISDIFVEKKIREIMNAHAERNYRPYNWDEISALVE